MKIGFYDSGLGGLTVLKEAILKIPNAHFICYGDTKNVPYGEKTHEQVIEFARGAAEYLIEQGAEVIVVACNTASSAAGDVLRSEFAIPIICMEPAIHLAAINNKSNKRILVLATNLTLKLKKYKELKNSLQNQHIDELPMPKLVEFAEQFRTNDEEVKTYLRDNFSKFNMSDYSFVVLGCTHFTYFKDVIGSILPEGVKTIDGNEGTVNQLINTAKPDNDSLLKIDLHLTGGNNEEIRKSIENYLNTKINFI